jgi:hypothetical protein
MTPRPRAALAGAAAATVWGLLEPLDQRVFRCDYSDVQLVGFGKRGRGFAVHALNGAIFGIAYDEVRRRARTNSAQLAVALALAEHTLLWPLIALADKDLARSPRAFAQGAWRHALFGFVLGRLA